MARTEGRIFSRVWSDAEQADFRALTVGAQWLYWLLLSQPELSMCGVMTEVSRRWANLAADADEAAIESWMDELEDGRFIVRDRSTYEVCIRSFVRSDGALRTPNLLVSMARAFGAVHSDEIRHAIAQEVLKEFPEGLAEGLAERFKEGLWERLPQGFREGLHWCARVTPAPSHQVTKSPHAAQGVREPFEHAATEPRPTVGGGIEEVLNEAARLLAEQEADRRGNDIGNRAGYIGSRVVPIRKDHEAAWRLILDREPTTTAAQLAAPTPVVKPSPLDATQLAEAARRELYEKRRRGEVCPVCLGKFVIELENGDFDDCECKSARAAS